MTALLSPIPPVSAAPRTAADLLHALGDVPADRVLLNPAPGIATEADLLRLVEANESLCELVDGTLVEKPAGFREGFLAAVIIQALLQFVREHDLGIVTGPDTTMRMRPGVVRLPDVGFISWDRLPDGQIPAEPIPTISPDLGIEILSPSNSGRDMRKKRGGIFCCRIASRLGN